MIILKFTLIYLAIIPSYCTYGLRNRRGAHFQSSYRGESEVLREIQRVKNIASYSSKRAIAAVVGKQYAQQQQTTNDLVNSFVKKVHEKLLGHKSANTTDEDNKQYQKGFKPSRWRMRIRCNPSKNSTKTEKRSKNNGKREESRT